MGKRRKQGKGGAALIALVAAGMILGGGGNDKVVESSKITEVPSTVIVTTVQQTLEPTANIATTSIATEKPTPLSGNKVWVSKSGSRYHAIEHCSGMKNPSQITEEEAVKRGLKPCKDCFHLK